MQHMLFCYLWIKSRHQWSITLCWTLLFWPLLGLVLLNYALVLGHWPTSKDFIWNSYVKCIIIGSVREPKKHWALYHPELSLLENKEDIPSGLPIENSFASTEKLIWFHIMGPVNLVTDHALVTRSYICGSSCPTLLWYNMGCFLSVLIRAKMRLFPLCGDSLNYSIFDIETFF